MVIPVLISYDCLNKIPQIRWLKTTEIFLLQSETNNTEPKSRSWQGYALSRGSRGKLFFALPASGGCQHSLACASITPILRSIPLGFIFTSPPPLNVNQISLPLSYKDTCDGTWVIQYLKILKVITSLKYKVIFIVFRI